MNYKLTIANILFLVGSFFAYPHLLKNDTVNAGPSSETTYYEEVSPQQQLVASSFVKKTSKQESPVMKAERKLVDLVVKKMRANHLYYGTYKLSGKDMGDLRYKVGNSQDIFLDLFDEFGVRSNHMVSADGMSFNKRYSRPYKYYIKWKSLENMAINQLLKR